VLAEAWADALTHDDADRVTVGFTEALTHADPEPVRVAVAAVDMDAVPVATGSLKSTKRTP
jgi:hypothetical protein